MATQKITIELEDLTKLAVESGKIFLTSKAEDAIVQLLEAEQKVQEAIALAKEVLADAAFKADPNFSSIQSDKIKVFYRQYGARYKIDESLIEEIPSELYSAKTSYSPNADAIEKWTDEHKGMPIGIIEAERPKSLSFSLKNGGTNE